MEVADFGQVTVNWENDHGHVHPRSPNKHLILS